MVRLVPLDVRLKLLLWNVEELLFEHGIDLCYQTVRLRWHKFGPMFAIFLAATVTRAMRA